MSERNMRETAAKTETYPDVEIGLARRQIIDAYKEAETQSGFVARLDMAIVAIRTILATVAKPETCPRCVPNPCNCDRPTEDKPSPRYTDREIAEVLFEFRDGRIWKHGSTEDHAGWINSIVRIRPMFSACPRGFVQVATDEWERVRHEKASLEQQIEKLSKLYPSCESPCPERDCGIAIPHVYIVTNPCVTITRVEVNGVQYSRVAEPQPDAAHPTPGDCAYEAFWAAPGGGGWEAAAQAGGGAVVAKLTRKLEFERDFNRTKWKSMQEQFCHLNERIRELVEREENWRDEIERVTAQRDRSWRWASGAIKDRMWANHWSEAVAELSDTDRAEFDSVTKGGE